MSRMSIEIEDESESHQHRQQDILAYSLWKSLHVAVDQSISINPKERKNLLNQRNKHLPDSSKLQAWSLYYACM